MFHLNTEKVVKRTQEEDFWTADCTVGRRTRLRLDKEALLVPLLFGSERNSFTREKKLI